jgi:DNA polymerase lambda
MRGKRCEDGQFTTPNPTLAEKTVVRFNSGESNAPTTVHDPVFGRHSSGDTFNHSGDLIRRSSSSKSKFEEHKFGEPNFGLKVKSPSKKRWRKDEETPPDRSEASNNAEREAQADSFARHLIRKKFKYSDLDSEESSYDKPKTTDNIKVVTIFDLSYSLSDDEAQTRASEAGAQTWTPWTDSPFNILTTPTAGIYTTSPASFSHSPGTKDPPPQDLAFDAPTATTDFSPTSKPPPTGSEIWFTGTELPRVLAGVRSTEEDDVEDPNFFDILKPAPRRANSAIEDEIRYKGPWADKYEKLAAAVRAIEADDDFDFPALGNDQLPLRCANQASPTKNLSTTALMAPLDEPEEERGDFEQDSQENDFSESQVVTDESDYSKNFGHSLVPISPYWERQRSHLACQKLPLNSPNANSEPSGTGLASNAASTKSEAVLIRPNYNKLITDQLERLEAICLGSGDKWRGYAYRKAANILKSLNYKVTSGEEALKLRGIGTSIAEKIGELIETGKLRKLDALQNEDRIQSLSMFMGIFGVGQSTANKWCALGYKTLEDIRRFATLTYAQAVGLKYYEDFQKRIPRAEMESICGSIKAVIQKIDPSFIVEICGSYRRGKSDCGDIDVIITHKRPAALRSILCDAVPKLHAAGVLTHDFVTIAEGSDKYMGVCQDTSTSLHRRIDLLTVPPAEWPFALLYFTGSGHFNRSMRFWAGKRGYSLSQHGLRVNYGNDNKGPYIAGITSEKQVFEALGLEYRPPEDRDV